MPLTWWRRALRCGVVVVGVLLGVLWTTAGPAEAHANLVSAVPGAGSVVASEPAQVVLVFSEAVDRELSAVSVLGPTGERVDDGRLSAGPGGDAVVAVRLGAVREGGTFVVRWRVTAADDGHATAGVVTFSVRVRSEVRLAAAASTRTTDAVRDVAEWFGFAGLTLLAGIVAVPEGPRRLATLGWVVMLGGAVVQLFVYGASARGRPLGAVVDRTLLAATLRSREGHALSARIALLAVVAVGGEWLLRRAGRVSGRAVVLLLLLALAATWSATSHAASGAQFLPALVSTTVHVTAMALWTGGLAMLAALTTRRSAAGAENDLATAAARFSRLAGTAVATLVVTGTYQAWRTLGSLDALLTTGYGRLLFLKVLILELVLAAAIRSGGLASRGFPQGGSSRDDRAALRRSIAAELCGAALLLGISVLLVGSLPARRPGG